MLGVVGGPVDAIAAPVLDQSNSAAQISSASVNGIFQRGQTFTVGVNGTLARIDFDITGLNATLVMEIMSVSGGLPTGTVLATATNPTDAAPGFKSFDFTPAGLSVSVGDVLAFVLSDAA